MDIPIPVPVSSEVCKECGYVHPPVSGGCPVAREKKKTEESGLSADEMTKFFSNLRSIILSKSSIIKKDPEKFYRDLLNEVCKYIQNL